MTTRTQGRVAGLIYLGVVITGILVLAYAPSMLIVRGDDVATLAAMRTHVGLVWAKAIAGLAMCGFYIALPFALARFLSPYGKVAALLMIALVIASIPFTLLALAPYVELALHIGDSATQAEWVARRVSASDRWMDIASIFWGLWLAPFGWLVLKSGAIPRFLGVMLMLGCAGYLANYFGPFVLQGYYALPWQDYVSKPGTIGELGSCLWLLIFGARPRSLTASTPL